MNQSLRIGIYAPHLHIAGGGEKYAGAIAAELSCRNHVAFIVTEAVDLGRLQRDLNLDLSRIQLHRVNASSHRRYLRRGQVVRQVSQASAGYDVFLNQDRWSCIPNRARRGVLLCEVPPRRLNPAASLPENFARVLAARLWFDYGWKTYARVIANSGFTAEWARRYYRQEVAILYPPVDTNRFQPREKKNMLLSVGRFFTGRHCKQQRELVRAFRSLYAACPELREWEYHLVGGVDPDAASRAYADECQELARGYPITFHLNAPFETLEWLYAQAKVFWHGAGYGVDPARHPECVEHFGIATVEAMAAGCVPVVVGKGGQREIVRSGVDGLYWDTPDELARHTLDLIHNASRLASLSAMARARSRNFDQVVFERAVRDLLERDA